MTKKDFIALAKVLRENHTDWYLVEKIADVIYKSNARLSKERFLNAVFGD